MNFAHGTAKDAVLGPLFGGFVVLLIGVACSVVVTQVAMVVTTVYLHRHLAHGGVELRPEVRAVSRTVLWVTTALKPRQWARVHRFHHATVDTPNDPHSPRNFGGGREGARYVLLHNGPLYTAATHDQRPIDKYRDLRDDRWDRWFFDHGEAGLIVGVSIMCTALAFVGWALAGGIIGVAMGIAAAIVAAVLHAASYLLAGGAVNGLGHGSDVARPEGGYARNIPVLGWLTVGEGWHRNHHAAENSPRIGHGAQLDIGWIVIRSLCVLRLARITARGAAGLRRLESLYAPAASGSMT